MSGPPSSAAGASQDDVEVAYSLPTWTELIEERFVPLSIRSTGEAPGVQGSVRSRRIGHLQAAAVTSVPLTFERTRRQARASDHDLLAVGLIERGAGALEQDGRRCEVSAGGFALYDTTRPFRWLLDGDWEMRVFTWPRDVTATGEGELAWLTARAVDVTSPLGDLVAPLLRRLSSDVPPRLSAATAVRLADEVAELTVLAAAEGAPPGADVEKAIEGDDALFHRVVDFVEDNLREPTLGAEGVARHFFVSTRTLHRMFAQRDLTVASWIKARRLDACRRALSSPTWAATPIRDVASRFGFANASFFSREFAARFGTTPREYRRRERG